MAFMEPHTYEGAYSVLTLKNGESFIVPDHVNIDGAEAGDAVSIEHKDGLIWHLSANGYMDQTDWNEAASMDEARKDCETMYNVCFDCGEDLPDEDIPCPTCNETEEN